MANGLVAAFAGNDLVARGRLRDVVSRCKTLVEEGEARRIAFFDDDSGRVMDIDLSRSLDELQEHPRPAESKRRGPGRPKLGVVCREVSLLPRHWQWLSAQRGGASATLRRLVDAARRDQAGDAAARLAIEAAHRFLWDIAGDLPGFEEATRALFRGDFDTLEKLTISWPIGIRDQLTRYTARARATLEIPVEADSGSR
jgi:hypothetical protein